jgi:TPR repeat protein
MPVPAQVAADTRPISLPPAITGPVRPSRRRYWPSRRRYWIGGIVAVLILAGATWSYLRDRPSSAPELLGGPRGTKDMPPALRPYYDRAVAGDPIAMRMLGTMYFNGLNVPQDTREGIRWYRKAAAAGSVAAGKDLEQLGLAPNEP